jgi:periplasmic copper chaperone A
MKRICAAVSAAMVGLAVAFATQHSPSWGAPASAPAQYTLGVLHISAPWMRATPKGAAVAGGYLAITNTGALPDRLMRVSSDLANVAQVHEMTMNGGVMTMREVAAPLEIKPGATLELKPGGYHVMFMQLAHGINEGDKVKVTLVFERAGSVDIEFMVGGLAATGPASSSGDPMQKCEGGQC